MPVLPGPYSKYTELIKLGIYYNALPSQRPGPGVPGKAGGREHSSTHPVQPTAIGLKPPPLMPAWAWVAVQTRGRRHGKITRGSPRPPRESGAGGEGSKARTAVTVNLAMCSISVYPVSSGSADSVDRYLSIKPPSRFVGFSEHCVTSCPECCIDQSS